jgi:hypothetical protein
VLTDDGRLADQVAGRGLAVDGVLDIVGNVVLRDSLRVAPTGPTGPGWPHKPQAESDRCHIA